MAKPKKKKADLQDPDEDFFNGVTCRQMLEIAQLATENKWASMHKAAKNKFLFGVREQPASMRNGQETIQYLYTTLEDEDGLEVRLYRDGFVGLYNWSDVLFKHSNARQVAALVDKYLQPCK